MELAPYWLITQLQIINRPVKGTNSLLSQWTRAVFGWMEAAQLYSCTALPWIISSICPVYLILSAQAELQVTLSRWLPAFRLAYSQVTSIARNGMKTAIFMLLSWSSISKILSLAHSQQFSIKITVAGNVYIFP